MHTIGSIDDVDDDDGTNYNNDPVSGWWNCIGFCTIYLKASPENMNSNPFDPKFVIL